MTMPEFLQQKVKEVIPTRVILDYFQNWGQPLQVRINALKEAAEAAGLKAEIELISDGKEIGVKCADEHSKELWPKFYQDLNACWPRGQFEDEERVVRKVIEKYQQMLGVQT